MKRPAIFSAAFAVISAIVFSLSPAFAAGTPNTTSYITEAGKAHTVHWAQGITPPSMPGQSGHDEATGFHKEKDAKTEYYVAPYTEGNGWYDINKFRRYHEGDTTLLNDSYHCFNVAATNLIAWWLDRNKTAVEEYLTRDNITTAGLADPQLLKGFFTDLTKQEQRNDQDPKNSRLYKNNVEAFLDTGSKGGYTDHVTDFFFNGYKHRPVSDKNYGNKNTPAGYIKDSRGGFLYPVFGKTMISGRDGNTRFVDFGERVKKYFEKGYGISIAQVARSGSRHAITLWGVEFDENGKLCAIFITDSDDTLPYNVNGAPFRKGMVRFDVKEGTDGSLRMLTLKNPTAEAINNAPRVEALHILSLVKERFDYYLANNRPMPENECGDIVLPYGGEYTVILDNNYPGGEKIPANTIGKHLTGLYRPSRAGYTFLGWYTEAEGGIKITDSYTFTGDTTIYAHWKNNNPAPAAYTVKHLIQNIDDDNYTLKETEANSGYTDDYTSAASKEYAGFTPRTVEQQKIKEDGSTVVEIRYTRNSYTITFDSDGGSAVPAITERYGKTVTEPAKPEKEGCTFNAWYRSSTAEGEPYSFGTMPAENFTLYAKWEINAPAVTTAEVTFRVINGSWQDGTRTDKTVTVTLTDGKGTLSEADVPSGMTADEGYENGSWNTAPDTAADAVTGYVTYIYSFAKKAEEHVPDTEASPDIKPEPDTPKPEPTPTPTPAPDNGGGGGCSTGMTGLALLTALPLLKKKRTK